MGEVTFDRGPRTEEVWFDVPAAFASFLSDSGNPWLACLAPFASRCGEALRLCRPVDPHLVRGAQTLMHIWRSWYPDMHVVPIEADQVAPDCDATGAQRTASLFSGGVDSFFTALTNGRCPQDACDSIDYFITAWGFDVPLENADAFQRMREALRAATSELGKELIDVATNLRTPAFHDYPWHQAHCGVLAALGLVLERGLTRLLIPSTHGYANLDPGGSHPLTDPLFSTRATTIVHHGSEMTRPEKLEQIVHVPVVRRTLRVCNDSRADYNCGRCAKCYCTMLHLYVIGVLDQCPTFPVRSFTPRAATRLDSGSWEVRAYLRAVGDAARSRGRSDVADYIEQGMRRTVTRDRFRRTAGVARRGLHSLWETVSVKSARGPGYRAPDR